MYAIIDGGVAPKGRVRVSGAKNSATRLLAAALLSDEWVELSNFPTRLVDAGHKVNFARRLGAAIEVHHDAELVRVNAKSLASHLLSRDEFDVPIRTTYLLAASQILRSGIARIPYPGGCPIGGAAGGGRGYDLHIMVWERLGCQVTEKSDHIEIVGAGFSGGQIDFPITTVGGTENALLCAAVAKGQTRITNAYVTPEVEDLIDCLRRMGAQIQQRGLSEIVVEGRAGPLSGARMAIMPDRIEALTWMVFAAMSGGDVTIDGVPFDAMTIPLIHLNYAGIDFRRNADSVRISPDCIGPSGLQPFELACGTHPGVISDMQTFYVLLALAGQGTSRIFDYRYPERIAFVAELAKLVDGDHLSAERGKITVRGGARFKPGEAGSTDLRGSMTVVMAALCAQGRSVIRDVHMALRGYNNLDGKLADLGLSLNVEDDAARLVASA